MFVRNTRTTMNPTTPQTAEYYDREQVAYLMLNNKGKLRVVTSFGHLGAGFEVGDNVVLVSDQSGREIGWFTIYAIVNFATGVKHTAKGMSPSLLYGRKLPHWVVK
jgi:hypothetical protein